MTQNPKTRPVALITGASRGIGAATAHALAQRGYNLVLAARSAKALEALVGELTQIGISAIAIPTDMQQLDQVRHLADTALAQFGHIDVLVNNAGMGGSGQSLVENDESQIAELLIVNLHAPIILTRRLLPHMIERRSGAIIMVGSVAGQVPLPGSTLYGTSKFGLRGFSQSLRRETRRYGIGVTLIAPGFIKTAMTAKMRGIPKASPDLVAQAIVSAIHKPRREVIVPWYYQAFIALDRLFPWVVDAGVSWVRGKQ